MLHNLHYLKPLKIDSIISNEDELPGNRIQWNLSNPTLYKPELSRSDNLCTQMDVLLYISSFLIRTSVGLGRFHCNCILLIEARLNDLLFRTFANPILKNLLIFSKFGTCLRYV